MSTMAFMDMNRVEGERLIAPRTGQFQRTPSFSSHPRSRVTTHIACSDCGFQASSELDFLRHVSTHKVVIDVENPRNRDGRTSNFPSPLKRMRMSLEDAERRFQHGHVYQTATVHKHNARREEGPATEQTSPAPLDLTTKPRRNTDEAPIDLRKPTSPTTQAVLRTGPMAISPGRGQSPDSQIPATTVQVTTSQLPAGQRHVNAPVMPRGPPPLIQVRRKSFQSHGILQVESRQTEPHDLTSVNCALVHPIIQQRMSNGQAFPICQGEQMKTVNTMQPSPPTPVVSPNIANLPPPPVGPKASSCRIQAPTRTTTPRRILPKQGTPSRDEVSTVSHQQLTAPPDTCDAAPARYHRLGRVPEYLRGGTWHPDQPTAVEYSVLEAGAEQKTSNRSSLEWAWMSAISTTIKQQRKRLKPGRKRGPKPGTNLNRPTRSLRPSPEVTKQPDKPQQNGPPNRQNKPQKVHNHVDEIELEQSPSQDIQEAQHQQQPQQSYTKELHKQNPEPNQQQSQKNDTEEQIEELKQSQGQVQAVGNTYQEPDKQQADAETTLCQDIGSKLWWQRLQELMITLGEKQKQDPSFAGKWFESLFSVQGKHFPNMSTTPIEKEASSEATVTQDEETPDDSGHARRSTVDSDYISMDEAEDLARKGSIPGHQSEYKEESTSPVDAVSTDCINAKDETSQTALPIEEELETSPEDQKSKNHEGVTTPKSDQVKSTDTTTAPGDTAVSPGHSDTVEKEKQHQEVLSQTQPLNVHFFRCTPCNFFTTSKQKKLAHIRKHREKFECSVCLKVCRDKKCLDDHMQEHTSQRQHECPHVSCNYRTPSISRLQSHKRTSHKNTCYQCPHCDYKTTVQGNMNRHVRKHTDERPYTCLHCPYAARVSHHLQEHMQRHAGERPFKCDVCSFATLKKTDLDRHQRCHTGEKPFACELCPYRAPQKRMLARHVLKIHQKQRPHRCQHCDFSAFDKKDIVEHMRLHSGEKPWKCSQCGYTTTRKRNLLRHVRVHTGEKPFQCQLCPYAAADRRNLSDHIRTHTDERPYRCTICGYGSRTKGQLSRHLKTQHEVKPYKCPHCPFTATDAARVHNHMQIHPHQLSAVYSNLFNLLGTRGEEGKGPHIDIINRGASDGLPSPTGSNESVSSLSGSPASSQAADTFSSGASDDGKCVGVSSETVPSITI
ncbi:ZNF782 [Branchiostoma lanceolatum]|nr:ZNF782 [Branchiostoma lanceolatum]